MHIERDLDRLMREGENKNAEIVTNNHAEILGSGYVKILGNGYMPLLFC